MKNLKSSLLLLALASLLGVASAEEAGGDPLRAAAAAGDITAQLALGNEYFFGRNRPVNLLLAVYWLRCAADNGSAEAQYNLGCCYLHGWGVAVDRRQAYYYLEKSSAGGIVAAQVLMAQLRCTDLPESEGAPGRLAALPAEPEKSLVQLEKLAKDGIPGAGGALARLLYADPQLRKNRAADIRKLLADAEARNDLDEAGLLLYATVLSDGIGGAPQSKTAFSLLEKAAEQGSAEALARMAMQLEFGFGCPADPERAIKLLRQAAERQSPRALVRLGQLYLLGDRLEHDPELAVKQFELAAKQDYPPAWRELAICLTAGIGVPADPERAFDLLDLAARAGDIEAAYRLGVAYRDGVGVGNDDTGAFYWFKVAALADHPGGMREAGAALISGRGCPVNGELGRELLRRAAAAGDRAAIQLLESNRSYR